MDPNQRRTLARVQRLAKHLATQCNLPNLAEHPEVSTEAREYRRHLDAAVFQLDLIAVHLERATDEPRP